jgi:hypothetical protein
MMEEMIIARLLATPAVTSIIVDRIEPGSLPQAQILPALVFNKISGGPIYDDKGEAGLNESRIQIDCWATTYTGALALGRAVRESLSAFFGASGGDESLYIVLDAERDMREGGSNAAEYNYRRSMDFIVLNRS